MEPTEGVQALARPNKALRLRRVSSLVFGTWCALFVLVVARVTAEVPADLLARLEESPQSNPTNRTTVGDDLATDGRSYDSWRAQHDSNVRPPGPQPDALSN